MFRFKSSKQLVFTTHAFIICVHYRPVYLMSWWTMWKVLIYSSSCSRSPDCEQLGSAVEMPIGPVSHIDRTPHSVTLPDCSAKSRVFMLLFCHSTLCLTTKPWVLFHSFLLYHYIITLTLITLISATVRIDLESSRVGVQTGCHRCSHLFSGPGSSCGGWGEGVQGISANLAHSFGTACGKPGGGSLLCVGIVIKNYWC